MAFKGESISNGSIAGGDYSGRVLAEARNPKPPFTGPRVSRDQLMGKYEPIPGSTEKIVGYTFTEAETGKPATDNRGALVFQTKRVYSDGTETPEFTSSETSVGEVIGKEPNDTLIFKYTVTRNW